MTAEIAALPAWIAEAFAGRMVEPRQAPDDIELDTPIAISEAHRWLILQERAVPGIASDLLYRHACRLKDYGLSPWAAVDMLAAHHGYEQDDIAVRVNNAWQHGQNEPGSDRPIPDETVFEGVEPPEPIDVETVARARSWWGDRVFPKPQWLWDQFIIEGHANLLTGKAKAGKTTFLLNLIVHMLAGRPFLGAATAKRPVVAFLAEDHYGDTRDKLLAICRELGCDSRVLDDLYLRCTLDEPLPDPYLARVDDGGNVVEHRFCSEGLTLFLKRFEVAPLLIIDPVKSFIAYNPYSDMSARKLVESFLNRLARAGCTPLLTEHPSTNSGKEGRDVGGSVQMEASFPIVTTLKAEPWEDGIVRQQAMRLEVKFNRYAPPARPLQFWRVENKFSYAGKPLDGTAPEDKKQAVYRFIVEEHAAGRFYKPTNHNGDFEGPDRIAEVLNLKPADVADAIKDLRKDRWLEYLPAQGSGRARSAGYLKPGSRGPRLDSPSAAAGSGVEPF